MKRCAPNLNKNQIWILAYFPKPKGPKGKGKALVHRLGSPKGPLAGRELALARGPFGGREDKKTCQTSKGSRESTDGASKPCIPCCAKRRTERALRQDRGFTSRAGKGWDSQL